MKTKSSLIIAATAMLLGSCSNEEVALSNGGSLLKDVTVTIEDADFSALTRASYVVDPSRGFVSSWTQGDVIGIYPLGGDQVAFPISEGEGSATARFDGGSWALRSNVKYSAYFPFSKSNYTVSETTIPVTYIGQSQKGNDSTVGLAAFDYLAAPATQPNGNGAVDLTMKHLGAFVRFQLTMPKAATLVSANIASDGTKFVTEGTVDLSASAPVITTKASASDFNISLTNITCAKDEVVKLYAMIAPANLSTSKLTITLTDNESRTYMYECDGKNFIASKSYNFTITETSGGTGATIPDAGWDEKEGGHEYVDLGLPSGLKWATCNVGASKPEEYGDYFAWGETEPYYTEGHSQDNPCSNWKTNKTGYKWSSYKWCNGSDDTQTKYCTSSSYGTVDDKTVLDLEDDAAHVNWGGDWRMPTKEEQDELRTKCTWTWGSQNGVNGYTVVGPNGNSLFLPAAGNRWTSKLYLAGSEGGFWSSSLNPIYGNYAYDLFYDSGNWYWGSYYRYYGLSVRAVCP